MLCRLLALSPIVLSLVAQYYWEASSTFASHHVEGEQHLVSSGFITAFTARNTIATMSDTDQGAENLYNAAVEAVGHDDSSSSSESDAKIGRAHV